MTENWRAIPDFEEYEISDLGRVRRRVDGRLSPKGRVKTLVIAPNGYASVSLHTKGKTYRKSVHVLVCTVFNGAAPVADMEVAHNDGSRSNNAATNLRWATKSDNRQDKKIHGRKNGPRGSEHGLALLDEDKVSLISARLRRGERVCDIADDYGVSHQCIGDIKHERRWLHVLRPGERR